MKNLLLFILKNLAVWVLLFLVQRLLFVAFYYTTVGNASLGHILLSFFYGLSYDLATACYLLLVPFVVFSIYAAGWIGMPLRFMRVWNLICLFLTSLIACSDIALYNAWGTKLNERALSYIGYPKEILSSVDTMQLTKLLLLIALQVLFGLLLFRKLAKPAETRMKRMHLGAAVPIVIFFMVVLIRGGFQTKPITKARAYYSAYPMLNYAGVNSSWNVLYDLMHLSDNTNKYLYLPKQEAQQIVADNFKKSQGDRIQILNTQRPNIFFIQLESWNADVIGPLGGEAAVTPAFNALCANGLLMKNFYANGFRTEHGFVSVLCAFPAQPKTSIIRNFGKFDHLPSLVHELDSMGYYSAAYYGANIDFANTGPFLQSIGFRKVLGEKDIPYKGRSTWGCYDEDLFAFIKKDIPALPVPFLSYGITITSHEPFNEAPGPIVFKGDNWDQRYRNSVHYTDKCLGDFLNSVSKESWYKNTLFVILADHSNALPHGRSFNEAERFRIPCLLYGDVLKTEYKGKSWDKMGSQQDLLASLLGQLNAHSDKFPWSRDLFSPKKNAFAYFAFEDGFGVIDERGQVVFDNELKRTVTRQGEPSDLIKAELLRTGKAIQQEVQDQYLHY